MFKLPEVNLQNILKIVLILVIMKVTAILISLDMSTYVKHTISTVTTIMVFILWSWVFVPLNEVPYRARKLALSFIHVLIAIYLITLVSKDLLNTYIAVIIFIVGVLIDLYIRVCVVMKVCISRHAELGIKSIAVFSFSALSVYAFYKVLLIPFGL